MAPAGDSLYLPPLGACLNGNIKLLTCRQIASELVNKTGSQLYQNVTEIIKDPMAIQVLQNCFSPARSTSQSKAQLESLTSAINITPTHNERYNVKELKEDASWLSEATQTDDVQALRYTVLEWQTRPAQQAILNLHEAELKDFNNAKARRQRLLRIYFEEQQWLFRCVEIIVAQGIYDESRQKPAASPNEAIRIVAESISQAWGLYTPSPLRKGQSWLTTIRKHLQSQMDLIGSDNSMFSSESMQDYFTDALYASSLETSIVQVVHGLQIILLLQWSLPQPLPPYLVMEFFSWMDETNFFTNWLSQLPALLETYQSPITELVIVNSLAVINIAASIDILEILKSSSAADESEDIKVYLQSLRCVKELNRILVDNIEAENWIAAPVCIAWCTILNAIHGSATITSEHRETRQTQKIIDTYGAHLQSDNESLDGSASGRRISATRRHSFGSDTSGQMTLLEGIDEIARSHAMGEDTVKHFGALAVNQLSGFSVIDGIAQTALTKLDYDTSPELKQCIQEILIQFVKISVQMGILSYSQFTLDMLFALLSNGEGYWRFSRSEKTSSNLLEELYQPLGDDTLLHDIMTSARGRFPHEGVPFIKLCRLLIPYQNKESIDVEPLMNIFANMTTYTSLIAESRIPYDLNDESDMNKLRLLDSLDVLAMTFPNLVDDPVESQIGTSEPILMPRGTLGQALTEDKPVIALWNFNYSAFRFCGLSLQLQLQWRTTSRHDGPDGDYSTLYLLNTEIIALLASWILKITSHNTDPTSTEKAEALLASLSDDLDRNQDVIAIIFALLEGESYKNRPDAVTTVFILRGLQFMTALSRVMPDRVWSFLSRSGFLGLHGNESRLTAIVAAAEIPTGTYDVLQTSIQLLNVLIEDAVRRTATLGSSSVAIKRFRASDTATNISGSQTVIMSKILEQFTKIIIDVFETSTSWLFRSREDELYLRQDIYLIFRKLISYTFDYDDESKSEHKLSASLTRATDYILDNFLSTSVSETLLLPLFKELAVDVTEPVSSLPSRTTHLRHSVSALSLDFTAQLVRVNVHRKHPISTLTKNICKEILLLLNVFVLHGDLRLSVIRLLEAVIKDIGSKSQSMPVFGALSEQSAKAFVQSLSILGISPMDSVLSASTWSLFSTILVNNQQWAAVYLLTGKTPKESLKAAGPASSKPIIRLALDTIVAIKNAPVEVASKMLEFVAHAADFWGSVLQDLKSDKDCKDACLHFLSTLQLPKKDKDVSPDVPIKFQIAAYITNILALLVHKANQQNDTTILKHLLPSIAYLVKHGAASPDYNASLHHGLEKNFNDLFRSNLKHFKRTAFSNSQLGNDFYYDKSLADTIFSHNPAWTGKAGKGFNNEFTRANINLSLVEAQVNLYHSWKSLAIELSEGLGNESTFQGTMIDIVKNCLLANEGSTMPESIFRKLCVSRADLAFTLLQRLLEVDSEHQGMRDILRLTWGLVQTNTSDLGVTLESENADYMRILLRILYLSLCAYKNRVVDANSIENPTTAIALDILEIIVAQGFRSLIGQLHQESNRIQPTDLALIIAILRACMQVPGVTNHSERLLAHFADERTIQHAGTLISWSDQLALNGDPIYGELSMMFLLELSTVQVLAEAIIVNGTLAQISSTTLFSYFRRTGGVGPFDIPLRMYSIWSYGYLPLLLNIVGAVGAPVAIEIATTLDQFSPQLKRASTQFDPKISTFSSQRVSLSMINEAHSLALLNMVINKFREAGSSLGIITAELPQFQWDAASVKEDLESLIARRHTLRECIVPTDEKEEDWSQQNPRGSDERIKSRLEERIVEEMGAALAVLGYAE